MQGKLPKNVKIKNINPESITYKIYLSISFCRYKCPYVLNHMYGCEGTNRRRFRIFVSMCLRYSGVSHIQNRILMVRGRFPWSRGIPSLSKDLVPFLLCSTWVSCDTTDFSFLYRDFPTPTCVPCPRLTFLPRHQFRPHESHSFIRCYHNLIFGVLFYGGVTIFLYLTS